MKEFFRSFRTSVLRASSSSRSNVFRRWSPWSARSTRGRPGPPSDLGSVCERASRGSGVVSLTDTWTSGLVTSKLSLQSISSFTPKIGTETVG